jgi:U3 small nucleolar RNA-associated protein MPP10
LYDLSFKVKSLIHPNSKALPELIIEDVDTEQIWQQIKFENDEEFSPTRLAEISKMLASKERLKIPVELLGDRNLNESQVSNDKSEEDGEGYNENEEEKEGNEEPSEEQNESEILHREIINKDDKLKRKKTSNSIRKRRKTTEVDDKFFKLDELDEYLKKEDKKEINMKEDNASSDDESIDLFNDFSDVDDDNIEDDENENEKLIKYADFFDNPESDNEIYENKSEHDSIDCGSTNESDESEQEKPIENKKKVKFELPNDSVDSDQTDSKENNTLKDQENTNQTIKSSLETRQERLKKRITELEQDAISEKPWQLKGEISALTRPQNSLLEEYVEFDSASRPAPIITEQTTMKLEDIITGRIKDRTWDDVEKKFKPVDTPMEYKKQLIMSQEKSKESLAQIYENEYIKQREALNLNDTDEVEKEPPEHIEIRQRMHDLFTKLDALSNFHYTPKLVNKFYIFVVKINISLV